MKEHLNKTIKQYQYTSSDSYIQSQHYEIQQLILILTLDPMSGCLSPISLLI